MNNIHSYVWRDARLTNNRDEKQLETKMVDMSQDQLQFIYNHCKEMLYNTDVKNPGRLIVIETINEQLECCRAELAYRYFMSLTSADGVPLYSTDSLMTDLRNITGQVDENYSLKDVMEVPAEYHQVKLKYLKLACRDALGRFDHSKISKAFISKMGLYLTQEQSNEIDNDLRSHGLNPDKFTLQQKIENHIKIPLGIYNIDLKINPKGLTESELRDMMNMKHYKGRNACKYSDLSSSQLRTLLSKVLYALEEKVRYQVNKWKEIMYQIEEVAKYNKFKLN